MNTVTVSNNQFYSHYPKRIPKGTVEAERVLVRLDPEWDGLTVRIHWANQASGKEVVSLLERDKPNSIPWEVLSDLGELRMGLLGLDGETTVKPTIWLSYGYVVEGVDPESGDDPQPPTPSWEQQMVEQATAAAEAAKAAQEAAESAGPYAQAAQAYADAAKASEDSAAASAQAAGQSQSAAAQAQVSAQSHATEAQQAQAAAEQAAQEAQTAQESAAQSAQAAATDAQRAETASQEAQDAAARAEAVDAYPRDVANDKFALALKTDTGKGTSHEISPDPGSNLVVTAYGYTEQEGEGDPSPENVRPIKVGGKRLIEHKITSSDSFVFFTGSDGTYHYGGIDLNGNLAPKSTAVFCSVAKNIVDSKGNGVYCLNNNKLLFGDGFVHRVTKNSTKEELKQYFVDMEAKGTPVTVWYEPLDPANATGTYTIVNRAGSTDVEYSSGGLLIKENLCVGDYVVSNSDGQCVEVHKKFFFQPDSSDVIGPPMLLGEVARFFFQLASTIGEGGGAKVAKSSHFKAQVDFVGECEHFYAYNGVLYVFINTNRLETADVDGLKNWLTSQSDAGTPVTFEVTRENSATYTHAPVPLIAQPDATGKVTVSGEKEVSAVYNKSIAKAIEELNEAIMKLGGTI